jgi:hypothetical protein
VKTCTKCKIEKPFTEFYTDNRNKDNLRSSCKKCHNECTKNYREQNKEWYNQHAKSYYQENKEKSHHRVKKWRQQNGERYKEYNREYAKKWKEQNSQRSRELAKDWYQQNKKKVNERNYQAQKKRRGSDPLFKLRCNLGNRTYKAFRNKKWNKNTKTQEMLGVDYQTAFKHIESRFKKGMSWYNFGEWHIDHIIPLASAKTEKELIELCHYTNLQPLWAEENIKKGDKIIACKL